MSVVNPGSLSTAVSGISAAGAGVCRTGAAAVGSMPAMGDRATSAFGTQPREAVCTRGSGVRWARCFASGAGTRVLPLVADSAMPTSACVQRAGTLALAGALASGVSGCRELNVHETRDVDPFPVLSAMIVAILAFMAGVRVGRGIRSDEVEESRAKGGEFAFPAISVPIDLGHVPPHVPASEVDFLRAFLSRRKDGEAGSRSFESARVANRRALGALLQSFLRDHPQPSDWFFESLTELAGFYARLAPNFLDATGDGAVGHYFDQLAVLFEEAAIVADARMGRAIATIAGMREGVPLYYHSFVKPDDAGMGYVLKESVKPDFARAAQRFAGSKRLWECEFGGTFLANVAEAVALLTLKDPAGTQSARLALLDGVRFLRTDRIAVVNHIALAFANDGDTLDAVADESSGYHPETREMARRLSRQLRGETRP